MSRTNRNEVRIPRSRLFLEEDPHADSDDQAAAPTPVDVSLEDGVRFTLDAVIRAHRWQLVQTARHYLRNARIDAEDVVQDVCNEALLGTLAISPEPSEAVDDLLREVKFRCRRGGR
jgi:hypothetical protein